MLYSYRQTDPAPLPHRIRFPDGAAAADISLEHYNGTTGFAIGKTITVPADATQVLVTREAYIYLEEGHSLRAQASATGDLELVISYEDIS